MGKKHFQDQVVLVTGAGGSIGSEIVRQLISLGTKKVVCVDRDEYSLYKLDLDLNGTALLTADELVLCDIRDYLQLDQAFSKHSPDIVFHAAAVKHLPLLEKSAISAFNINVVGTKNVTQLSIKHKVSMMVNISTDKAANPSSNLGYSKRIAEIVASHLNTNDTTVASVRFGNVFASRGSFMETLQWQAHNDMPITITHPDASRYFMSIPQAAGLVIESALIAEPSHTYVLDMGDPVRILDAVERYLKLVKSKSNIEITGLRKGEKLHEELYDNSETRLSTKHPKIFSVRLESSSEESTFAIDKLAELAEKNKTTNDEMSEYLKLIATNVRSQK